jgi:hypothetical protein
VYNAIAIGRWSRRNVVDAVPGALAALLDQALAAPPERSK